MSGKRFLFLLALSACLLWTCLNVRAEGRFTDNGDGTVTDHELGLMWAQYDNQGDIDWKDAMRYCRVGPPHLIGRYENWRMPKPEELASLYAAGKGLPERESDCGATLRTVKEIRLSCAWVWSDEVRNITAAAFDFHRGLKFKERMVRKRHYRALPVRNLDQAAK